MAEAKTQPTTEKLDQFLARVPDANRRAECEKVAALMEDLTGCPPVMWGTGIVGFGLYRYKYASGKEGDWPVTGFASRKSDLTLYLNPGVYEASPDLMAALGKFKIGKSCLYLKKLDDVHMPTLKKLLKKSVDSMKSQRVK